jgi:hypothetical protein
MSFTCHDCRTAFADDPVYFTDTEVGKSSTWVNLGNQVGSTVTRHYQKFPVCSRCHQIRASRSEKITLAVAGSIGATACIGTIAFTSIVLATFGSVAVVVGSLLAAFFGLLSAFAFWSSLKPSR